MKRTVELEVVLLSAPSLGTLPARRNRQQLRRTLGIYLLLWPAAFLLVALLVYLVGSR